MRKDFLVFIIKEIVQENKGGNTMEELLKNATLDQLKATWFDLEMESRRVNQLRLQIEQAITQKIESLRQAELEAKVAPVEVATPVEE